MAKSVYWDGTPPTDCQICETPFEDKFFDAATRLGPWGQICPSCMDTFGYGTGKGKGQEYQKQADGSWLKVA